MACADSARRCRQGGAGLLAPRRLRTRPGRLSPVRISRPASIRPIFATSATGRKWLARAVLGVPDRDRHADDLDAGARSRDQHLAFEHERRPPAVAHVERAEHGGRVVAESRLRIGDRAPGGPCDPEIREAVRAVADLRDRGPRVQTGADDDRVRPQRGRVEDPAQVLGIVLAVAVDRDDARSRRPAAPLPRRARSTPPCRGFAR